jgi:hypothetical protein
MSLTTAHRLPFNSGRGGSERESMTWRARGLANVAHHVIGYISTQDARVRNASR